MLRAWLAWIREQGKPSHLSLHFDGVRLDRAFVATAATSTEDFCARASDAIFAAVWYRVSIVEKTHHCLLQGLRLQSGLRTARASPSLLLEAGNCILLALHHLQDELEVDILSTLRRNREWMETGADAQRRTYRQCFTNTGVAWQASPGWPSRVTDRTSCTARAPGSRTAQPCASVATAATPAYGCATSSSR